ncbi:MAG TPA: NADH-quinone oxidoreductase subunit A [Candidatus Polarisedimenticolaceae bacterium]|nr:NADH-quinone oxidoreductase subunit A [Candidatus Polarisedimenticolaceae bacterium]
MSDSRLTVLLVLLIAGGMAGALLALSHLIGRVRGSVVDQTPYECGMKPYEYAERRRFSIHFYLVAMVFILFDIEVAFLFPWAVTFRTFDADRLFVLGEMFVFLGILIVGFVYLWKRGALEWE